jgi:hypothetical protein
MSDELKIPTPCDAGGSPETPDDEFEEITSDEVDRIVAALDDLMESTDSLNIRSYLEEAAASIYCLVYDAESDADELDEAA